MALFDLIAFENEVFLSYAVWSMVLVIKMLSMSYITGLQRFRKKAFASPEDVASNDLEVKEDEDVERVRRAHLNDMENIYLFFTTGFIFVLINPDPVVAMWLFRVHAAARVLHTLVYAVYPVRPPVRTILFTVASLVTWYMSIRSLVYFGFNM